MRISPIYNCSCADLTLCDKDLVYVSVVKYLGVYITAASSFKCSYDNAKLKFYRAFNALYCRSACSNCELVSVELIKAYCLPMLFYAVESTAPSRRNIRMMDRCINMAVMKIFKVSSENCAFMRYYLALNDVADLVKTKYDKFLTGLIVNQFQTELVKIAFDELFTIVV